MTEKTYSLEDALKAQAALRAAAGMEPERFAIDAFVGMVSDEIEVLRTQGKSDEQIAAVIRQSSRIDISSDDVAVNYAPPEARHRQDD